MTPSDPVELVLGTLLVCVLLAGSTGAGWLVLSVLLRIFGWSSYDESANEHQGADDDDW